MSGPKYSDYVLERQRLLQIQAQLEAELERSKCNQITEQINECLERSDLYFSQIDIAKFEKNITTAEEIVQSKTVLNELKKLISELKKEIAKSYGIKGNSEVLANALSSYENKLKRVKNLVSRINHLMRELNAQYNQQRQENLSIEFENTEWEAPVIASSISENLMKAYSDILEQIMDCENFEQEKAKYDAIMQNHTIDDNFKIKQMKMRFDAYLVEKQSDTDNEELLKLRSEFVVLSNLIYGECIEVPDDIEELKKEIAEMLIEAQSQKVGEYVAECIDKVMTELGYSVVGSEVLSAQKMTKQHYDYSSDSAITVASSESGAMMLEVVGKKNEDGTNGSTAAVKADMERFCPDFQKVKKGLQQYGVTLTDKKLCPPDEKYVRFVDVKKTTSTDRRITARNRKKRLYNE